MKNFFNLVAALFVVHLDVMFNLDPSIMFPMAEQALGTALALEPENSEALATLGLLRQLQGRPGESREALERAIAVNPNNAQAHTWLGRSYAVADPARYLVFRPGNPAFSGGGVRAGDGSAQIEFKDQDPRIHELFEEECAKRGTTARLPDDN